MLRVLFFMLAVASFGVVKFSNQSVEKFVEEKKEVVIVEDVDTELIDIDFCGDTIPLKQAFVAHRYQRTIKDYDNPTFRRMRNRVQGNMKVIEPILQRYGIPADLKYIPIVESTMTASAVSPRGAVGYWQFMPETAREFGLKVDDSVDERKNLIKSTHAACKYLLRLHRQLGSWTLVAAAYNAGPTRIRRHVNQQQNEDYFRLRMNQETSQYVFRLVAAKEWFTNPDRCKEWRGDDVFTRVAKINETKKLIEEGAIARKALAAAGS
ncbi:lytic transglycosylase domain-containing protein [Telluribacter humicola]|uniref:lytic transglycosylase domain-containing protein n=1 Tax=Telluribacter humicola TaxID=1720261 RepID=UPI001E431AFF|nr:lytic transglycosylase domain-containing protein [Telluribacter humicola]